MLALFLKVSAFSFSVWNRALQRLRAVDAHCHVFRKQHLRADPHGGQKEEEEEK